MQQFASAFQLKQILKMVGNRVEKGCFKLS